MNPRIIVDKILVDKHSIHPDYDNKCWFEMDICEIRTYKGTPFSSKTTVKYNKLDVTDNSILLCNNKGKTIRVLTRENTDWIDKVYLCDRHMRVLISDLHFVTID